MTMAVGYHDVWVLTYHTDVDSGVLGVYETLRQALARGDEFINFERLTDGTAFPEVWSPNRETEAYVCAASDQPSTYVVQKTLFERVI
jgi:hypothetical protein